MSQQCRRKFLTGLGIAIVVLGCGKSDTITTYEAPREEYLTYTPRPDPPLVDVLLAASFAPRNAAWFFKVAGDSSLVEGIEPAFREFLGTVRFPDDSPTWTLPDKWQQRSEAQSTMRYATIDVPAGDAALELTVVTLPYDSSPDYAVNNVNRWRGQLQLRPVAPRVLDDYVERLRFGDKEVVYVNYVGKLSESGPMAGRQIAERQPSASRLQFEVPAGWQPSEGSSMSAYAFEVAGDDASRVSVTVTRLGGAAGGLASNVNRWRQQVGATPLGEAELEDAVKEIPLVNAIGDYVAIESPEGASKAQAILGVIVNRDGATWFFKLQGDLELARREREKFEAFVQSVEFPE